jgi:hypothetical protein
VAALVADGMRLLDAEFQEVGYLGEFAATEESVDMIKKQHTEEAVLNAEAMKTFAVEAPDGGSDALLNTELHEVKDIVDYAATHENADMINRQHAEEAALVADGMRTFAVEASDGSSDAELEAESHVVEDIVEFADMHEDVDMINIQHAEGMKTFAVEAPDGTSDVIVDFAPAAHEDVSMIPKKHAEEEQATVDDVNFMNANLRDTLDELIDEEK